MPVKCLISAPSLGLAAYGIHLMTHHVRGDLPTVILDYSTLS